MATKAPKKYKGNVQFDIWGNLSDYFYANRQRITADNFDCNGKIQMERWDDVARAYVMRPVFWTEQELDIKPYTDIINPNKYVAEINNQVEIPNYEFNDTLEYLTHYTGRSSTSYTFKSLNTGRIFRVFSTDIEFFIRKMDKGIITGDFTFRKKCHKFGIIPV